MKDLHNDKERQARAVLVISNENLQVDFGRKYCNSLPPRGFYFKLCYYFTKEAFVDLLSLGHWNDTARVVNPTEYNLHLKYLLFTRLESNLVKFKSSDSLIVKKQ